MKLMKRRDFLLTTSGVAGYLTVPAARAAVPCPPPMITAGTTSAASTVCPSGGGLTTLASAVAAMSSGQSVQFTVPGLNVQANSSSNTTMLSFAGKLVWDPVRRTMHQLGTAHTGGAPTAGGGGWISYSENTHTFSRTMYTWAAVGTMGHQYYNTTVNPSDGTLYHVVSGAAGTVYRKPNGSTTWSTGFIAGANPANTGQWSYGVEWFPEANSGAGGLCLRDYRKWWISNSSVSSWTSFSPNGTLSNGDYWSVRVAGFVHVGVGTTHFSCSPTGTHASRASLPIDAGSCNRGTGLVCAHPNGTDLLLFELSGSRRVWRYAQASDSWGQMGTHAMPTNATCCIGSIPHLGVVMAWIDTNSNGNGACYLYKV